MKRWFALAVLCSVLTGLAEAQLWSSLLKSDEAIDWSSAGVGGIPERRVACAVVNAPADTAEINARLAACPAGQAVVLGVGTYEIAGTIRVPAEVTLRGAGADRTVLNATGRGGAIVQMGGGDVAFMPRALVSSAQAGASRVELASTEGMAVGSYLVITEENDGVFVSTAGSGGRCTWCDGGWTKDGEYARGQIVEVKSIADKWVTIWPALYSAYQHGPIAVPFRMAAVRAGVEDLQVRANNTGYAANFAMEACAYCWIKGVESNYADGDHVSVRWGFHDEVRDSYFSNAFLHVPGEFDSDIRLALKTTATLVENNIIERTHESVMLQWGAAGNVVAYNYMTGGFDSGSPNVVVGGINFHGAHPQFNLLEGNVLPNIYADSVWGSSSDTTAFRNWIVGTNRVCLPLEGRGTVSCSGRDGHYGFQAARAVQLSYRTSRNRFLGNVVGSDPMQSLKAYGRDVPQVDRVQYPAPRGYEAAIGWSLGYGSASDDGSGDGCGGGVPPCHAAGASSASLIAGNYSNLQKAVEWGAMGVRAFPPSFYLRAKPAWWGELRFPGIGPDVKGQGGPGGHGSGNPAQRCYAEVMGVSDGCAGSPLAFNAARCYGGVR